ncbi:MAG: adenylosuccinate synthetase [Candidatus Woesebacteria bacterium]|jgi:adenylosuccinate synthase
MSKFLDLYQQVYKRGSLFAFDKNIKANPFMKKNKRFNSVAIAGGALGDEGKGRVTDELTARFLKNYKEVIHYRDNGGANAGHTVEVGDIRIALHQIGSGILQKGCTVVLGKEMVLHPEDLVAEINDVKQAVRKKTLPANFMIDEMAVLTLDTHRAFEAALKNRTSGGKGATGRGISPAYADVVYRHPLRMKDLMSRKWKEKVRKHYKLYQDWIKGMGENLSQIKVARLAGKSVQVGSINTMLNRLDKTRKILRPYVDNISKFMEQVWQSNTPIVFEKAQALGLDKRWGVYPDVTASNCGFDGILSSTEGTIDPDMIAVRAATIKATYTSSVGARKLPTMIKTKLAARIREDAKEYGATTKRPRDIAYIDLPMLSYLFKVGKVEYLTITHLDISYPELPIKVCVAYTLNGKEVGYRPDQDYLDKIKAKYIELPTWDGVSLSGIRTINDLPKEAKQYLAFISQALNAKLFMVTTGPKRDETIKLFN